jgi:hypothetical protein
MALEQLSLSDAQKLELRPALARVHGALLRAWQLGMFVPATAADEELLRNARKLFVNSEPYARTDGDSDLVPLSDEEYLAVFDGLFARFRALAGAYRRSSAEPLPEVVTLPQPSPVAD